MIELKNISFSYEEKNKVLKDITLKIERGERIFLLGENGSGKSSLMLLLNGINKPAEGEYSFLGKSMKYDRKNLKHLRQKVGIVFQDPDVQIVAPDVESDVEFGPLNLDWTLEKVRENRDRALELCDLEHLRNRSCSSLSYGEKRRVAVAGIIAMEPEVVILDEPTTWLDPYHQRQLKDILKKLWKEGKTIIISTHDLEFAKEMGERFIFLKKGKIEADGDRELLEDQDLLERCRLK